MRWSEEKLKRHIGCGLAYIAVSIVVVLSSNCLATAPLRLQPAPYSQFVQALNEGMVTKAVIWADSIVWQEGQGKEAIRYRADRVPNMDDAVIVERLRAIEIEVTEAPFNPLRRSLLRWVLPLSLLVAALVWSTYRLLDST
jgi:hypothetical protein